MCNLFTIVNKLPTAMVMTNRITCYWTTNFKLSFGQLFLNYLRLWSVSLSFLFCLSRMFFFLLLFLFTDQIFVSWRQAAFILVVTMNRLVKDPRHRESVI